MVVVVVLWIRSESLARELELFYGARVFPTKTTRFLILYPRGAAGLVPVSSIGLINVGHLAISRLSLLRSMAYLLLYGRSLGCGGQGASHVRTMEELGPWSTGTNGSVRSELDSPISRAKSDLQLVI